jgi:2-iminobutanoate/2-iminopropanoate deaminase
MSHPTGLPYTPALRAGDWLIISGQVGIRDGAIVDGGFEAQLHQTIENLRGQLEANGLGLADVSKTTCFLVDMADYAAFNEIYGAAFAEPRPARSCVAVAGLPLGAVVEIEAWAHVGS